VALEAFRLLDPDILTAFKKRDGDRCHPGDEIGEVTGSARSLLIGERTALNFLQRLSGIATMASRFVDAAGGRITILDTRKTTPTLRVLEKYAVRAGGATNHRAGLFDAILIKDNPVRLAGGVAAALARARGAEAEGTIVVAEHQTAGRGRQGREWFSPAGSGLYVSIVLRPSSARREPARAVALLTLAAGVALAEAVEAAAALRPEI